METVLKKGTYAKAEYPVPALAADRSAACAAIADTGSCPGGSRFFRSSST